VILAYARGRYHVKALATLMYHTSLQDNKCGFPQLINMQMKNLQLNWIKCGDNPSVWCDFLNLDLDGQHFRDLYGVYLIWHGGQNPWTVRLGQGGIAERLSEHRRDQEVLAFRESGLKVSWAQVDRVYRDGVEAYLASVFDPKVGDRFPDRVPIKVNLP